YSHTPPHEFLAYLAADSLKNSSHTHWRNELGYGRPRAKISASKSRDICQQKRRYLRIRAKISYIFLTILSIHIIIRQTTFHTIRKDYRPARISPHHSRAHRATKPEKGGKEQTERPENSANRPILLFSFAFPLFQVSFWSLSGLIQGLSGNKETKAWLWPRTKPGKSKVKY
ncbi:MAG TPA: hypothetical protein H9819_02570, partial [Candidatus Bacteroides merdipullorum]|nr:hypothetical protein [Candidatus Bacteroides merdipullorum]